MNSVNNNNTTYQQLITLGSVEESDTSARPGGVPPSQLQGPDGGGGGGGSGGVRAVGAAAPPQQQQDKAPPLTVTAHPTANHMMNAYHPARPPAQPPPPSGNTMHSYVHYASNHAALRPTRQQHPLPHPARAGPLIPFFTDSVGNICTQLYSPAPPTISGFPVLNAMMYSGGTGTSDTGRAQPPPSAYTWGSAGQPSVTIMTAQPQAAQPNPQQQTQAQPSPYPQGQFFVQPRMHGYTAAGGGGAAAGTAGMQQGPPSTLLVDRALPPALQVISQSKNKSNRKNRIPIINPATMMEIDVEDKNVGAGGVGGGGHVPHPDHTGSGGQHPHIQHSSNQMSSSAGNALVVAADFAKQVAQVAMNNETPSSRPPREEEPQVNGPASVALGPSPAVMVEEATTAAPTSKRPPGLTPVVSAQAEGTTYDIQSIRSSNNRNVEIRSGESSPARSKAVTQSSPSPVAQVLTQSEATHAPPPPTVIAPQPQIIPSPIQIQEQQQQQQPQVVAVAEPPKQQRRPRGPAPPDNKEKIPQPPKPAIIQVEEKDDEVRNRTSSGPPPARTQQVPKEKEIVKQISTPAVKTSNTLATKQTPSEPITNSSKAMLYEEEEDAKLVASGMPDLTKYMEVYNKKAKIKKNQPPLEKPTEKTVSEPALIAEKQVKPVPIEVPRIAKTNQEKNVTPPPAPASTPIVSAPPPKSKTTFALDISLENMHMTAKAAAVAVQQTAQQQQSAVTEHSNDQPQSSHPQAKAVSRTKQKMKQKLKDINQKGNEKEGTTDMDAFVDIRTVSTQLPPANLNADNNNRTAPTNDNKQTLANKQQSTDISNRTVTQDSNKDNRNNVDNALRPSDATTRLDSNIKNDRDKSPAATEADATNNNSINNQIAQQYDEDTDATDIVAAKNEENMKKSGSLTDSNSTDSSQVISASPPSQPMPKYQYKDDQWSPVNPQGKKVYDRDFLMKLRENPLSSEKPNITPDLEIFVKDRDTVSSGVGGVRRMGSHGAYGLSGFGGSMRSNGLYPDFNRTSMQRMAPKRNSQGGGGNRGPGGGGGGRSLKMFNNSASMRDDYKLNQCENAWKPTKLSARNTENKSKEEREAADLYKKVRGILNKLTPQKFDTLLLQFQNLPINSLERLQGTITLVFEKALDEPAFSVSYANLCKFLGRLQVMDQNAAQAQPNQSQNADQQKTAQQAAAAPVNFRKILITKCQQEFETNKKLELDFEKKQLEINECPDPEKRKELQFLFNEEERRIRMKSVGLVTFIGELFKLRMLTVNIMHGCIKQLLGKIDEESLECLCKLLTTIGKEFEDQITGKKSNKDGGNTGGGGGIEEFNSYFTQMTKLSKKHDGSKVSSRVRFMLQDVIELRQNNWVPRRDENKPKTMAQIQEEVLRESEKAAAILASQPLRPASQNMNQDRNQRRNNLRGGNFPSEDGWSVVNKYGKGSYASESTKIQGLKSAAGQELEGSRSNRGEISLAPTQSFKWNDGAASSSRRLTSSNNFSDGNMYSLLDNEKKLHQGAGLTPKSFKSQLSDDKDKDKEKALQLVSTYYKNDDSKDRERDRDSSRGRIGGAGGSPNPSLSGPPMKKPQENIQKRPEGRSESSRESTPSQPQPPVAAAAEKQVSRESPQEEPSTELSQELRCVTDNILQEYANFQNLQESIENYKERFVDRNHAELFVSYCLDHIVEQCKEETRTVISRLLGEMVVHNVFSKDVLVTGLEKLFEFLPDLIVDIPHLWKYVGEIFAQLILIEALDFSHLKQCLSAHTESENRIHESLNEIFKTIAFEKYPVWLKKKWDSSNVQLSDFIKDKKLQDRFKADYCSFIEGKEVTLHDSIIPIEKVQQKLLSFLKASPYQYEDICNWLTLNVGNSVREPVFIRQLTEAVIKSSLSEDEKSNTTKLDKDRLRMYTDLIKRYVEFKEELELWCLYSIQYLVVKTLDCPRGMLVEIFQELYESLAISIEGFKKWRQEESTLGWQKEGRGVAIASTNSFFVQMEQYDEDDPPS